MTDRQREKRTYTLIAILSTLNGDKEKNKGKGRILL